MEKKVIFNQWNEKLNKYFIIENYPLKFIIYPKPVGYEKRGNQTGWLWKQL